MAPRRYQASKRAQMQEETRLRILEATVALHAEKGVVATSYAEIASRADVAIPTVYKHFPDRPALLFGCTAHAARDAPRVDAAVFSSHASPTERFGALVEALYARHAHLEPWLRWAEHRIDPTLAAILAQMEREVSELIREALCPGRRRPARSLLALAAALCGYPAWETMVRQHGLSNREAVRATVASVASLLSTPTERPHR